MKLSTASVGGLFGTYDHSIELDPEGLTFIHSTNGMGKSVFMKLIQNLLTGRLEYLERIPFADMRLCFDDGTCLNVRKDGGLSITMMRDGTETPVPADKYRGVQDSMYISPERLTVRAEDGELEYAVDVYAAELERRCSETSCTPEDGESVKLFQEIANSFFVNKKLNIKNGVTEITMDNGDRVPLETLSSGEKHILIIFYRILFEARRGSLVIIDEPEISIHVSWQQKMGAEFLDLCRLRDLQMLVATHSPQIIHDLWDRANELGGGSA